MMESELRAEISRLKAENDRLRNIVTECIKILEKNSDLEGHRLVSWLYGQLMAISGIFDSRMVAALKAYQGHRERGVGRETRHR